MRVEGSGEEKSGTQFYPKICLPFCRFEEQLDDYSIIMVKALSDRLAEVRGLIGFFIYSYTLLSLSGNLGRVTWVKTASHGQTQGVVVG